MPIARSAAAEHTYSAQLLDRHTADMPLAMPGILRIAYKLLVNDRAKFAALLVGISFAVFLMIEMTSLFAGVLHRSSATVINIGSSIWVMDPAVQTVANTIPLPNYVLDEVRSLPGVKYAVPLYSGSALLKLRDGTYQAATIVGLDDTSLVGSPQMVSGNIQDIFGENAFIAIDDSEFYKLENPRIGTEFELNDHRGKIVGIARVASSALFGTPTLYTTYYRALQYIPNTRFTISYILVEPKTAADIASIKQTGRGRRLSCPHQGRVHEQDLEILHVPDRHRHQHAADDPHQLHRRALDLRPDLLHLHSREHRPLRRPEGDRREVPRARLDDPLPGDLRRFDRLRLRGRTLRAPHLARPRSPAGLRGHDHLPESRARVRRWCVIIAASSSYFGVRKVLRIEPFDIFRG